MALCPEHPKRDQNPKFTPLSETTSIPVCFIWEFPPPPGARLYISAVYATGQQEDEDGKSLVRAEREKAITFVFCRDLY